MRRTLSLWLAASLVLSTSFAQTGATGAAGGTSGTTGAAATTGAAGGTTGSAGPAAASSTQQDPRGFLTRVNGSNPFAEEVVQLARALRQQYLEFYQRVSLWPQNVAEIMERYRQYFATYQAYFQAVRNYLLEEQRSRSFSGRVFARYTLWAAPDRPMPMPMPAANGGPGQAETTQNASASADANPNAPDAMIARPDMLDIYPLEGATVSLFSRDPRGSEAFFQLTNVQGSFSLPNLTQGRTYEFRVEMDGFETQSGTITIGSTSVRRRFVLQPRMGGDLHGQVLALTPGAVPVVADILENKKTLDETTSAQIADAVGRPRPPRPTEDQAMPISLENFEVTYVEGLSLQNAGNHVIRNRAELRKLLREDVGNGQVRVRGDVQLPRGLNFERETLLIVALGGRPTGGYGVKVTGVTRQTPGNIYTVSYSEGKPGRDDMVTQAFTYPTAAVTIRHRINRRAQVNFVNDNFTPPEPQFQPLAGVEVRLSPMYWMALDAQNAPGAPGATANASPTSDAAPGAPQNLTIARPMPQQEYSTFTDEWGNFGFQNVQPGSYRVEVKTPGYLFYSGSTEITAGTSSYSPIYLVPDNFIPPPPGVRPAAETTTPGNNLDDPFNTQNDQQDQQ